jgi:hypothetical protein
VLLRRDWEFLFEQLKSTRAVLGYLERVAGEAWELGREAARYFRLAQADEAAEPSPIDSRFEMPGVWQASAPLLPMQEAATGGEREAHLLVRLIFEDVATSVAPRVAEPQRLDFLAALDGLPVGLRGLVGQFILDGMEKAAAVAHGTTEWRFRRLIGLPEHQRRLQLGFGVCSQPHEEMIQDLFSWWVELRHHEAFQIVASDGDRLTTVGVLLTPRIKSRRPWDTTMIAVADDLDLPADRLSAYRQFWDRKDDG